MPTSDKFYGFLRHATLQPLELNTNPIPKLAMVNIPILSKVQIVFDVAFGLGIIGAMQSTIANQYVMLIGEGGPDLGCPNILTFPDSIHHPASMAKMTVE